MSSYAIKNFMLSLTAFSGSLIELPVTYLGSTYNVILVTSLIELSPQKALAVNLQSSLIVFLLFLADDFYDRLSL